MGLARDVERERFWRGVLGRRDRSGVSIAEFCRSEGLKASTFRYWQREIRRRDEQQPSDHCFADGPPVLVPARIIDQNDDAGGAPIEIVATNGYRVRVGQQVSAEQLRRVLAAVNELC